MTQLGFLDDTTQLDLLVPRLRQALLNSTGGTGKASQINFATLQAELDAISRNKLLKMKTPAFFSIIIRSLTILEGFALSVDPDFRLVRGAYPYVLAQLLTPDNDSYSNNSDNNNSNQKTGQKEKETPQALQQLLTRLLTINGEGT
jgi:aarF domain-containing kinase